MVTHLVRRAPLALLLCGALTSLVQGQPEARLDPHGDSLPTGALVRLGTVRWRHGGAGATLAFAPDGKTVVSGGWHSTLRVWDMFTGRELQRMPVREKGVRVIVFSPDGTKLAAAGSEGRVCLLEAATGKEVRSYHWSTSALYALAFSPDGKFLASAGKSGVVNVLDLTTGRAGRALQGHEKDITGLSFTPDGKALATASMDQTVRVWSMDSGKELFRIHDEKTEYHCIGFSADGAVLATGGPDSEDSEALGRIQLWDTSGLRERLRQSKPDAARLKQLVANLDNKGLIARQKAIAELEALGEMAEPALQDALTNKPPLEVYRRIEELLKKLKEGPPVPGQLLHTLRCRDASVATLALTRDGQTLAAIDVDGIHFWNTKTGKELPRLACPQGVVQAVAFAPDGRSLAFTAGPALLGLAALVSGAGDEPRWELAPAARQANVGGHLTEVGGVAFAPDGRTVASFGAEEKELRLWDAETGRELRRLDGQGVSFNALTFSRDGMSLAAGGERDRSLVVRVWDTATFKESRTITTPEDTWLFGVLFAPDGQTAAAVQLSNDAKDGLIHRWDLATGKPLGEPSAWHDICSAPAIFPDGKTMAVGDQKRVIRIRDAVANETHRLSGLMGEVERIVVSGNGKLLAATATWAGRGKSDVRVWDSTTGKESFKLELEAGQVNTLAFSADGRVLAIGGQDGAIRMWSTLTGRALKTLQGPAPVTCLAFSADGQRLASGGADTAVLIWKMEGAK